jgi:hypothetical protein
MRRNILYVFAISIIGAAIAAGCGSEEQSSTGGSGKEVPLAELHTVAGNELCARLFRCCDADERKSIFSSLEPLPTTQAECEAAQAPFILPLIEEKKSAIEAGRLAYHPDLAGACYEKLGAVTCAEFRGEIDQPPVIAECTTMFEGKVALGGQCAASAECAGTDALCSGADAGATEPTGTCVKKPSEGESCINVACAEGYVCESSTCNKLKGDGAPCEGPQQCASGFCNQIQVCMAKKANGEACDSNAMCVSGECSSAKMCAPFVSGMCDGA